MNFAGPLIPTWFTDIVQDIYLATPPPSIQAPKGISRFVGYDSPDGRLYWQARNHQLFSRYALSMAEFRRLLKQYPTSSYVVDARYDLSLMELQSNPSAAAEDASSALAAIDPSTQDNNLWPDVTYVEARAYEQLKTSDSCQQARNLYAGLTEDLSDVSAMADIRSSTLVCI